MGEETRDMGRKGTAANTGSFQFFLSQWSWSATIIVCALGLAATGAFLLAAPFLAGADPATVRADWLALACLITGLFTANMARMLQIWGPLATIIKKPATRRNDAERKRAHNGFRELFAYVFLALTGLTTFTFLSAQPGLLPWADLGLHGAGTADAKLAHVAALITCLALSFVPLLTSFWLHAKAEEEAFKRSVLRDDAISAPSFWVGAAILGSIIALAGWATKVSGNESAELASNLTLFVTLGVIALFVAFIFLPHLVRYLDQAGDKETGADKIATQGLNPIALPAQAASYLDSVLVRLIAPLTGATQKGRGVPHSFVLLSIIPLTGLGFVLAPPFGLVPIALGMLMVIALGRRWAWIEEDRETASRLLKTESPEIQVGFENDLKDEALLGYASLFLLVPLALHQTYGWQTTAFEITDASRASNLFFAWLSFFGAELAKAVPFVDWWEIYQVDLSPPIEAAADNPLGKHLTFAARAMVDLVIMAALLQAIGIWQRSRTQRKLYKAGQVDAFDPFLEEQFFQEGMRLTEGNFRPTDKFIKDVKEHADRAHKFGDLRLPYNERRLTELLEHEDKEVRAGAEWMIRAYDVLAGPPEKKLSLLADKWDEALMEHIGQEPEPGTPHPSVHAEWRRDEKPRIELVVDELLGKDRETVPKRLQDSDIRNLMRLLRYCDRHAEFHYARMEILEILAQSATPAALWALVAQTCPKWPETKAWVEEVEQRFGEIVRDEKGRYSPPYFKRQEERATCYSALGEAALLCDEFMDGHKSICEFLNLMKEKDAKTTAGPAAAAAYERLGCLVSPHAPVNGAKSPAIDDEEDVEPEFELT
ncbi:MULTISPECIES: hypothetical protein [Hyphomonas]|uniref:hypothetical protein n=1 Tax=Hyphomonas TaxID=85 RepID=UPI000323B5E4|nr:MULTISPECIES: hypothetical protein [Hyphomonas]